MLVPAHSADRTTVQNPLPAEEERRAPVGPACMNASPPAYHPLGWYFMRHRYYSTRPPLTKRQKVKAFCFFLALVITAVSLVFLGHLKRVVSAMAETVVSNRVNGLVTSAVEDALQSGVFQYDRLVAFEKDGEGRITALQSNMAEFNRLQAAIIQDILQRLGEVSTSELTVPLGTLTGSALMAGRGPALSIRMQTVGSASARFTNAFSDAGINQTTHRILLEVNVSVNVLLPGFQTDTQVSNRFSVAETVIVGSVPDSYVYFHSSSDVAEDYVLNNA